MGGSVIIWLNGPFGGGKTTVATELVARIPNSMIFDPEHVVFMLRTVLPGREDDFQDLGPWRPLVAAAAVEIASYTGQVVITPMSVLRGDYADEIFGAIAQRGFKLHDVVLHADQKTIYQRINGDQHHNGAAREFRLAKMADYHNAMATSLTAAHQLIDTSNLAPSRVAEIIAERVTRGLSDANELSRD
jgi:hypothetical protein